LLLLSGGALAKTDVVTFNNGDRLTGEIKSLERGRLRFKTDATDTISIEWNDVAYLSSDHNIQVETILGTRYLGYIGRAEERYNLVVQTEAGAIQLNNIQVIKMTPIEDKGVNRLDGDISVGYNFTKANEVEQLNIGLELEFRTVTRVINLSFDSVLTDSLDNDSNQRENFDLHVRRLLRDRWLWGGTVSLTRNDELGIDLRTTFSAGGGRIVRQTDHSSLILEAGLSVTREELAGNVIDPNPEPQDSIEAYGTIKWDWFRFDTPELDLSTTFQVIPNLTDTGRVRGELDTKLKWEMVEDLFWELSYYHSHDSRPPTIGAEKNDYGIVTSVGYKF
jgi:putative salt-induced outer membrane protein YdiY